MLKILFASAVGVVFAAQLGDLPGRSELVWVVTVALLLALLRAWLRVSGMPTGCRRGATLLTCGAAFLSMFAYTNWRAADYMGMRESLQDGQQWLVEVAEQSSESRASTRARLILLCGFDPRLVRGMRCPAHSEAGKGVAYRSQAVIRYSVLATIDRQDSEAAKNKEILPGMRLIVGLSPRPWRWRGAPGFDEPAWALSQGILARVSIEEPVTVVAAQPQALPAMRDRLRQRLQHDTYVEPAAFSGLALEPVARALMLGDRTGLSGAHWRLFQLTGTSHLMAISGMHLGIVSGWVYWVVLLFVRHMRSVQQAMLPQLPAGLAAMAAGLLYSILCGFSLPTQRAFLMLTFAVLGSLSARPRMLWNGLLLALLVILVLQPFAVLSAGLWLSFAAVAVVFFGVADRVSVASLRKRRWLSLLRLQGLIFVFMIPFSLHFFGIVSLNSVLTNLVAIPWVTLLVLPLCLMQVVVTLATGYANQMLGEWIYWLIDTMLSLLQWMLAHLPLDLQGGISLAGMVLALLCLGAAALSISLPIRLAGVAVCSLLLLLPADSGGSRLLLLGERLPLLIVEHDNRALVVDLSPGLSDAERRLLAAAYPRGDFQELPGFRQTQWQRPQRSLYWLGDQQLHGFPVLSNLCRLDEEQRQALSRSFAMVDVDVLVLGHNSRMEEAGCALSMEWHGARWLWLGDLSREQQLTLLDSQQFQARHFDIVFAWGKGYSGALYNRLKSAAWFIWRVNDSEYGDAVSLRARGIRFAIFNVASALVPGRDGEIHRHSLVRHRFYHPMPSEPFL